MYIFSNGPNGTSLEIDRILNVPVWSRQPATSPAIVGLASSAWRRLPVQPQMMGRRQCLHRWDRNMFTHAVCPMCHTPSTR
jgi:hypothetical protein